MPEKSETLNKTVWFLNPWFDIVFLAGFPVFFIIAFLFVFIPYYYLPSLKFYFYVSAFLFAIFNFPHMLSDLSVLLDSREIKDKTLKLLWLPFSFLLFTLFLKILSVLFNFSQEFERIRHFWGPLHVFLQHWFILKLYNLRNNHELKFDNWLEPLCLFLICMDSNFTGLLPNIFKKFNLISLDMLGLFILLYRIIVYSSFIIFLLRQLHIFIRYKRIYMFKIVLFFSIFTIYYGLSFITKSSYIAYLGAIREVHNFQWILFIWLFHRIKFKTGEVKEAWFISHISQTGKAKLYFLIFALVSFGFVFSYDFWALFLRRIMRIELFELISIIQTPLALSHFFIDIFIWRYSSLRKVILEQDNLINTYDPQNRSYFTF